MHQVRKREFFPSKLESVRPSPEVHLVDRILCYFRGLGKGWEYVDTRLLDSGCVEVSFKKRVVRKKKKS